MKLIKRNLKEGKLVLRLEVADDLWYLDEILAKGDIVSSKTQRRIETSRDVKRAERADKETVTLGVEVDSVEFDENVDRLRVTGKIVSGPEDIPTGDFHTLNLHSGLTLTIQKEEWTPADLKKVEDATKVIKSKVMLVAVEDGTAAIGFLRNYGVRMGGQVSQGIAGKDEIKEREMETKQFFAKVKEALEQEKEVDRIVIAGPGFTKDELFKYLQETRSPIAKKVVVDSVSTGGEKGLQEIVNRGIIDKVVKETKIQKEVTAMNELMAEIHKDGLATYGYAETKRACGLGAIKVLLVSNSTLKIEKIKGKKELDELIRAVDAIKGEILLVSAEHDLGKQLEGLGGVAAVLRYKI
ncbi:MAG: mRNA surveillance protein pelota [archaeon]